MSDYSKKFLLVFVIFNIIMSLFSCQTQNNVSEETRFNDIVAICNEERTIFSGTHIVSAKMIIDQTAPGRVIIEISFDEFGNELLRAFTSKYLGETISLFVKETKISTARIMQPLVNGKVWISGYHKDEAEKLLALFTLKDS